MISSSDLLRVSLRQVIRQRAYGVIASIALGITAFITLSVLGGEIRYNIGQDMVLMGGVNIVEALLEDRNYVGQPLREFQPDTIEALRSLPEVASLSQYIGEFYHTVRNKELVVPIVFTSADQYYWETFSATLVAGRFFSDNDLKNRRRVLIVGWELANNLYDSAQNAIGKTITLNGDLFEVVGVVGGVMLGGGIRNAFLPTTTMHDRQWGGGKLSRLFIRAISWEDIAKLEKIIPEIIAKHQDAPYLTLRTRHEQLDRVQNTFIFVEALLWLGIMASLLLGGFGIWYGTFAAIRARTREVGLKKAMGGADIDILAQFLMEALCKSVAGGVLGIFIGTFCVELGAFFLGSSISYPLLALSSVGSILFSAIIGVAGGMYPALQASRMDVVTALRFE